MGWAVANSAPSLDKRDRALVTWASVVPAVRPVAAAVAKLRFLGLTGLVFPFTLATGGGFRLKVALLVFGMSTFLVTAIARIVAEVPRAKLKEVLIDRRMPSAARDRLPLLCFRGEIAWVPGVTIGHRFRITGEREVWVAELSSRQGAEPMGILPPSTRFST